MTTEELKEQLKRIQKMKCETQNLELKTAQKGCPKRLYDTLSSFSNQDDGGIIIFGVNESEDYKEVGVYDPQDLQKKVNEQCLQMEPVVPESAKSHILLCCLTFHSLFAAETLYHSPY